MKVERTKKLGGMARYFVVSLFFGWVIGGCVPVSTTLNTVQSFEVKTNRIERAFSKITGILVNKGFDIKTSNQDAGIVTTEYKQFASTGTDPPFDYYLQIRTILQEMPNGQLIVKLVPIVKEQNRMNAAAFTEKELAYFTGEPSNVLAIEKTRSSEKWRSLGQTMFMNVVTDVAGVAGVSIEEVKQNVTSSPVNTFDIGIPSFIKDMAK